MSGTELDYIHSAFAENWIAPLGPNVNAFEAAISSHYQEKRQIAALSSGTAALHLGLEILGVGAGDEVLCQSLTFSASANPIVYLGASPVFVDSEWETYNMDPVALEMAIESRIKAGVKPKAIVAVHLYGMPYQNDRITQIAQRYDIPVLEDSAESLGSHIDGVPCGSFGDIAILSFNGNKIITTSGGGALVCRSEEHKKRAIYLATQARDEAPHYQHSDIGYNYRMSNILAGIGRGQMEVLADRVASRRKNYTSYKEELAKYEEIDFLEEPEGYFSNRWLSTIMTPSFEIREKIRLGLWEENIESRPMWKPMHLQPVFQKNQYYGGEAAEGIFDRGLCLPSGSNLTEQDLDRVLNQIHKIMKS
ncbi:pyridoxal phosphate-dependent aminotransferase [Aureicoccus marinus]|uniref:Pyridoxal phosphate-dependent aminotransferase n=2 Tax=Aureicoccus marinus TaxID=754435 RepID=A0A2S7TB82_9FLAO|nr:pyridoxal phosphate-dependent aminotransferase [Aureicoccus marinus]